MPRCISRRTTSIVTGAGLTLAAYLLGFRPRCLRLGATDEEVAERLPGADLVPLPMYQTTCAIAIRAAPATVWAWLIQLGQGRGGFYTFDRLENLADLNIHMECDPLIMEQPFSTGWPLPGPKTSATFPFWDVLMASKRGVA